MFDSGPDTIVENGAGETVVHQVFCTVASAKGGGDISNPGLKHDAKDPCR
jgi:hypothetical protein